MLQQQELLSGQSDCLFELATQIYGLPESSISINSKGYLETISAKIQNRASLSRSYWSSFEGVNHIKNVLGLNPQTTLDSMSQFIIGPAEQCNPLPTVLYPDQLIDEAVDATKIYLRKLIDLGSLLPKFKVGINFVKYQQFSFNSATNTAYFRLSNGTTAKLFSRNTAKSCLGLSTSVLTVTRSQIDSTIRSLINQRSDSEVADYLQSAAIDIFNVSRTEEANYLNFVENFNHRYIFGQTGKHIPINNFDEDTPGKLGGFFRYHLQDPDKFFRFLAEAQLVDPFLPVVRIANKSDGRQMNFQKFYWNFHKQCFSLTLDNNPNSGDVSLENIRQNPNLLALPLMRIEYLLIFSGLIGNVYCIDDGVLIPDIRNLVSSVSIFANSSKLLPLITILSPVKFNY